jgi:hypothetical protein
MKSDSLDHARRLRGRAALHLFACLLVPAALLSNACGSDDDDAPTDASIDGSRDAARDSTADREAGDAGTKADASDAAHDAQTLDATTNDAGDANVNNVDATPGDAASDAHDASSTDANTADTGIDGTIDAGNGDARIDVGTGDAAIDGTIDANRADADVDVNSDAAVDSSVPQNDATAVDAGSDVLTTLPDAAANDATTADAAASDAANDAATADADAGPTTGVVRYSFETGVQGWAKDVATDTTIGSIATSTVQHDTGTSSLAVTFTKESDDGTLLSVETPPGLVPGKVVTVRMFIPDGVVSYFDIYDMDANDNWADDFFQAEEPEPFTLHTGGWYTYSHRISSTVGGEPDAAARHAPIQRLGLKIGVITAGTIYIDSITW